MNLSTEASVLWARNKFRKQASHSRLNTSQTTDCFWEDLQRAVGFYRTSLRAQNNSWSLVEKGQKPLKKTEVETNEFPFRSCCGVIAASLIAQGFLFPDKVLQLSASTNVFQHPFLALCPPRLWVWQDTGISHNSTWLLPWLLWIHTFTRYPQCRVAAIPYCRELDTSIQIKCWFPEILKYFLKCWLLLWHPLAWVVSDGINFLPLWFSRTVHIP